MKCPFVIVTLVIVYEVAFAFSSAEDFVSCSSNISRIPWNKSNCTSGVSRHKENIKNATVNSCPCFNRTSPNRGKIKKDIDKLFRKYNSVMEKYFHLLPIFDSKYYGDLSRECKKHLDIYLHDLKNLKLWALKMYDSSAKVSSGILNGNVNLFGDFDQCLSIRNNDKMQYDTDDNHIKGQYCLTSFQVSLHSNASNEIKMLHDLVHSHHLLKSNLNDSGHRVPRFSSITWGLCIPNGCSSYDIQNLLKNFFNDFVNTDMVNIKVMADEQMCQVKNDMILSYGAIVSSSVFLFVIFIVAYATYIDSSNTKQNEVIMSFSLRRTLKSLISLKRCEDDIKSVHGIRFVNAVLLIIAHRSMASNFYPYINRTIMAEKLGTIWTGVARVASLYTDTFIMFSGMLTCYSILRNIEKNKSVSILKEYLSRLFRLVPTLGALILFCTWILPLMGSGPQWPAVVQQHSDNCKKYWWRNFLFLHNYFGFKDMCFTHTHHIGIDTQLFVTGLPAMLYMCLQKKHMNKILLLVLIFALLSTFARFYISYTMDLANYIYYGVSNEQLHKTTDHLYTLPPYRFTVYAIGIYLAIALRHPRLQKLSKLHLTIGWSLTALFFYLAVITPANMNFMNYKYNSVDNALFSAFAPIVWCCAIAWIVYTSHLGYNNSVGNFLSWNGFIIWTRISYAVYLTQFPLYFYYVGLARTSSYYTAFDSIGNGKEIFWILTFSVIVTLLFDLPFQSIKNYLLKNRNENINHKNAKQSTFCSETTNRTVKNHKNS